MIRLLALVREILGTNIRNTPSLLAKNKGLERKAGFGNYGPKGKNVITHRTLRGKLMKVRPHKMGQQPELSGEPMPLISPRPKR